MQIRNSETGRGCFIFASKTWEAFAKAEGIPFKRLDGHWKGEDEEAFLVMREHVEVLLTGGHLAGEETLLYLTKEYGEPINSRLAYLIDLKPGKGGETLLGEARLIGLWRAVPAKRALRLPNWTRDPASGVYFVAVPLREALLETLPDRVE